MLVSSNRRVAVVKAIILYLFTNGVATNIVMIGIVTITNNISLVNICFFVVRKVCYIRYFIPAHKYTQISRIPCNLGSKVQI
jgi:hypothetical protein